MERDQEMSGGGERRCLLVSLGEGTLINPFTCCQGTLLMVLGNMVTSGNLPPGKVIDKAMPLSAPGHGNSREQMRLFRTGSRGRGCFGRGVLPGRPCRDCGTALVSGETVTPCLVLRKKTRADAAGGTSRLFPQQRGLLPRAVPPPLLPVGRRVCQRHREGEGRYLRNESGLALHLL